MYINKDYDIRVKPFKKKNGDTVKVAYVYCKTQNILPDDVKEQLKKFGAKWLGKWKVVYAYGWWLNPDNEKYITEKYIKPVINYLASLGEEGTTPEKEETEKMLNELIRQISETTEINNETKESIKSKLESFKEELINELSSEEFFDRMKKLIDFGRSQGHHYSLMNTILIYMQDPQATMVKSKTGWARYNRIIKENSKAIFLIIPKAQKQRSKIEKDKITNFYLDRANVKTVKELTPGEKERLSIELRGYSPRTYDFEPLFYDIRFTEVIEGKEDVVEKEREAEKERDKAVPWYDATSEVTEETEKYSQALIRVIEKSGVQLEFVDDLGGARGVSMGGKIQILKETPHNKGFLNDICHEFSHELLHQTYLKSKDKELADYFLGKFQGRDVIEQQAELSAWIVLRTFGFELPTGINYVGMWGLRKDKAADVFDSVARTAQYIINNMNRELGNLKEGKEKLNEITGLDVARLIGMEDVYLASKKMKNSKNKISLTQDDITDMVHESVKRILKGKGLLK